jgi:small nuclear ribonucleoprotein (snRNP)-like protein
MALSTDPTSTLPASELLDKVTAVTLTDGRQIIGTLAGIDGSANILLYRVHMKKQHTSEVDGEVRYITRTLSTLMIPFSHISAIHQTTQDCEYDFAQPNTN